MGVIMPKFKTVDGVKRPAGDFLVVEDPDQPSTWHLPVKTHGELDSQLMGAAHAALTVGYRGNKYQGPNRAKALAALKKMYSDANMEWPKGKVTKEAASDQQANLLEVGGEDGTLIQERYYGPVYGITSFAGLRAAEQAQDQARRIHDLAYDFERLVGSIMESEGPNKARLLMDLADEFKSELANFDINSDGETEEDPIPVYTESDTHQANLVENFTFPLVGVQDVTFAEADWLSEDAKIDLVDGSGPVRLRMVMVEPGWGNTNDNNYYPREVLQRDIHVFKGKKMYATDHKPGEKSILTEVGTVLDCPIGFTETGAPVAMVGIHHPIVAQDVRNRAALGVLDRLEASILGNGLRRRGKINGKEGNIVEAITDGVSLDLVTKAGAGGRALALAESTEGANMLLKEQQSAADGQQDSTTQQLTADADPQTRPTVVTLTESVVAETLSLSRLPQVAQIRLLAERYLDQEALLEAIRHEREYIKTLSGSGQPLFNDQPKELVQEGQVSASANVAEANKAIDAANDRFLGPIKGGIVK